jgi:hypothetical protein
LSKDVDIFPKWPKTPRLLKDVTITEKIDGSNGLVSVQRIDEGAPEGALLAGGAGSVLVDHDGGVHAVRAGSRNRWLTLANDNYGFCRWVTDNAAGLVQLGTGLHYGEWFGSGIQRGYGLTNGDKRFALFNVARFRDDKPGEWEDRYPFPDARWTPRVDGLTVVPVLGRIPGGLITPAASQALDFLEGFGSLAVEGFDRPEGIMLYHEGASQYFKAFTKWGEK